MAALRLHLLLVLLFLWAPLLALAVLSLSSSGAVSPWPGLSLHWYEQLWQDEALRQAALNSALVALASALPATLLGTLLALGMSARRRGMLLEAVVAAPIFLPELLIAVALLSLFALFEMTLGLATVALAQSMLALAFVTALARRRLQGYGRVLLEASINLGASRFATFWRIVVPLVLPGVLAGFLLALALSLGDYVIASLTGAAVPASETLPVVVWRLRAEAPVALNALVTVLLLAILLLSGLAVRLSRPPRMA